jgi:hypothetical protein
MDTTSEANMSNEIEDRLVRLNEVFGALRAEYLRSELFDLFTHPTYWPELLGNRPCLLVGGRGTGKTTVLRSLSYEGQEHLNKRDPQDWDFIGLYWRVDTSVVTAFRGVALDEAAWVKLFAHYVNLILTQLISEYLAWLEHRSHRQIEYDPHDWRRAMRSLGVKAESVPELQASIDEALAEFEIVVNNIAGGKSYDTSILGRPVQYLLRSIQVDGRIDRKTFYFLIDEYENFEDYQQRVVNTLIKHAGDYQYSFKVGMRETGHRERSTLNPQEQLIEPADYAYINIADRLKEENFGAFAYKVCEERLRRLVGDAAIQYDIEQILPSLSEAAEAAKLGVTDRIKSVYEQLEIAGATHDELTSFQSMDPMSAYLVGYWSESKEEPLRKILNFALTSTDKWQTRLSNYQHAMLYTIRSGKRGISKYYSGWDTYVHLADGNIRYLLQLVNEALQMHIRTGRPLTQAVPAELQTDASQAVGGRIVQQLQGVSAAGADLTRLVLGLGRIFQVMASEPQGHTPEVSQFRVVSGRVGEGPTDAADPLLSAAVMHLAVRRFPGDKMARASGETKGFDYQLHPIFAPFFTFSYRSKRRITLTPGEIMGLVSTNPGHTIRSVLEKERRQPQNELPEQLTLFRDYYGDTDS